jgi:hypothetical protein
MQKERQNERNKETNTQRKKERKKKKIINQNQESASSKTYDSPTFSD